MTLLSGKKLTALSAALIVAAAAAAVRVAATGTFRVPGERAGAAESAAAEAHLALARAAEGRGDIGEALSRYRMAAERKPGLVDRRSPEFLGAGFERRLKEWVTALRSRRLAAGPRALEDASTLFRRMYGGCG